MRWRALIGRRPLGTPRAVYNNRVMAGLPFWVYAIVVVGSSRYFYRVADSSEPAGLQSSGGAVARESSRS